MNSNEDVNSAAYVVLQEIYQAWKKAMDDRGHPDGDREFAQDFEQNILPCICKMMGEPATEQKDRSS